MTIDMIMYILYDKYMNIYITKHNQERLRTHVSTFSEQSMSGLINSLLNDFFDKKITYSSANVRTTNEIMLDIDNAEAEMSDRLTYCQDPDEIKNITSTYKHRIDELWTEFHESNKR